MMKTNKRICLGSGLTALLALSLAACSEFSDLVTGDGGTPVALTASADSTATVALTRAADGLYNAATGFDGTEQVRVFMNTAAKGGTYNVGTPYDDGGLQKSALTVTTGSAEISLPTGDDGSATLFGVFPAASAQEHTVKYDQTADANYKQSDLMYAATTVAWASAAEKYALTPNLPFEHQLVKLKLTVVKAADVSQVQQVRMMGVKRTVTVTPTADGLTLGTPATASDGQGDQILISSGERESASEESYTYCCVFPAQAWDDGNGGAADFLAIDADGGTAIFRLQRDAWMPGHEYTLTLSLNTFLLGMTATLSDWTDNQYSVTIRPTEAEGGTLTVAAVDDQTYTGSPIMPTPPPDVYSGNTKLTPGTDYTMPLTYYNNTNAGTAIIVAQGKGDYEGQIGIGSFNIVSKSISDGSIAPIPDQVYCGAGIEPEVAVYAGDGTLLTRYTDYNVSYSANLNVGTATATVTATGGGNYTGSLSTTFKIVPRSLSAYSESFVITLDPKTTVFNGSKQTTSVASVVDHGLATGTPYTMAVTTDYTVGGQTTGTDIGTYTVTVTGTGNYCDSKTATWTITTTPCTIETPPTAKTLVYNGAPQELVNMGTAGAGGTMYYGMTTDKSEMTLTTSPTATEQGTYYVWYYVKADDANHTDTGLTRIQVTIAKRPVTLTTANDATISLNDLSDTYGNSRTGKTYSGLTASTFTTYVTPSTPGTDTGLASGHYVSSITIKPSIDDVGIGELMPSSALIKDAGGTDVTSNYAITYDGAALTVTDPGVPLSQSLVGYKVGSNGKAYDPSWKMPGGVTTVGMTAYKNGTNGIVIAKDIKSSKTWSELVNYSSGAGDFYVADLTSTQSKTWTAGSKSDAANVVSVSDINSYCWKAGVSTFGIMNYYLTSTSDGINSVAHGSGDKVGDQLIWAYSIISGYESVSVNVDHMTRLGNGFSIRPMFTF